MDIAGVYQLPTEPGVFHLILRCACEFVIVSEQLDDTNPPCPLHEPWRYLGTQPTPAPTPFDDDDWDEPH